MGVLASDSQTLFEGIHIETVGFCIYFIDKSRND